MSTVRDLINGSARLINIIQKNEVLDDADMNIAVDALNGMIDSWSNNRLLIYNIQPYEFTLTGAQTYTLGVGGDWNVPNRPIKIEQAYARLNPGTQQQLDISMQSLTVNQYSSVSVKNMPSTFPFSYYDDGNYPLRNITLFPVPTGPADIIIWLRQPLLDLTNIDAQVNYPPGYERAFRFNLAIEMAPEFGKEVDPLIIEKGNNAIANLEIVNSVPRFLKGDGGMVRSGRNRYFNWITGGFFQFGGNP